MSPLLIYNVDRKDNLLKNIQRGESMKYSVNWIIWRAIIAPTICEACFSRNGKIYSYDDLIKIGEPQLHPNCRCRLERMQAIIAGNATELGTNGADWWIKYLNELPNYYITRDEAEQMGWVKRKGNLASVAPGYMIFGGVYYNDDGKLPQKKGRIWYEADINYKYGYRNNQRLLFSNDGLIFVTYDHYGIFLEITGEEY